MAKNKQVKKEDKKVEVKPKGPKVDYTPKNAVPKKKQEIEKPAIAYYGEGSFTVTEEGATCSWNEGSRQLCLDAAQEMIEGYAQDARPALFNFAARAALIENAKELTNAEYQYFGGQVTMGSHMKRQRFWKFVSYIGNGRIPNDLVLYTGPRDGRLTAASRALIMQGLVERIKQIALQYIQKGWQDNALFRVAYVVRYTDHVDLDTPEFVIAQHDYDPETMKGYKTLKDWSTRP